MILVKLSFVNTLYFEIVSDSQAVAEIIESSHVSFPQLWDIIKLLENLVSLSVKQSQYICLSSSVSDAEESRR